MKKTHKKKIRRYEGYDLIPHTAGVICNGLYLRKDKQEIIIQMAWGKNYRFGELKEGETSI